MFTGIVKEMGTVKGIRDSGSFLRLTIGSKGVSAGVKVGDSVAVNGVCLTAVKAASGMIEFDVMEETARRSTISVLKEGDRVNLESPVKSGGTFDGHFVQGHVDCVGRVRSIDKNGKGYPIEVEVPAGFEGLYVDKGSVAIDGVSLTVGSAGQGSFIVHIIPHTLKETTLGMKRRGDELNIEFDIIGKYALKASGACGRTTKITEGFLEEKGFI